MSHKPFLIIIALVLLVGTASAAVYNINTTYDGRMGVGTNLNWSAIRNATGTTVTENPTSLWVHTAGYTTTNIYDDNWRSGVTWDTSALPDDCTINSATISVYGSSKDNSQGANAFSLISFTPANKMTYVASDYGQTTFARQATDISYAGYTTSGWNTFTLNAAGLASISKTGNSAFMFAISNDTDAINMTWATGATSGFEFRGLAYNGGSVVPNLSIVYTNATPSDPNATYVPPSLTGTEPLQVTFTNMSTYIPTSWNYSFQDVTGNNTVVWFSNGTTQSPTWTFNSGNFLIRLYNSNADGNNQTPISQSMYVNVSGTSAPVADFSCLDTTKEVPAEFYFTDTSTNTPSSWHWTAQGFPDMYGTSSDFLVEYTVPGDYWITLIATNAGGSDTENKTAFVHATAVPPTIPVADFTANRTGIISGEAVGFIDASTGGATSWYWSYTPTSPINWQGLTQTTEQNPVQTFSTPGTYSIREQVTNGNGTDSLTRTGYITVSSGEFNYSTPGSYTWVCPEGITSIYLNIGAGGGSGHGGWSSGGFRYSGYGGSPGEYGNVSRVSVVPGTSYPIIVGAGGDAVVYGADSNDGGASSAFSNYKNGGLGGLTTPILSGAGGNAINTNFMTTSKLSTDGGDGYGGTYAAGTGGTGYSAGGGGGASASALDSIGGAGAGGYVGITSMSMSASNVPDFSGYPRTGGAGLYVNFTDLSDVRDTGNMTYLWDFGDGTTSTTMGSLGHVYSYTGSYTVNLTITSDSGAVSERKGEYIAITKTDAATTWYSQKLIRFNIVDAFGTPLEGANVNVSYISTSLPNTDSSWLMTAFGVNPTVAAEMASSSLAMSGNTGNDGSIVFTMFPAIKYGISITNASMGLSKYVEVFPQDTDYTIRCILDGQVPPVSRATSLANSTIFVTEPNASYVTFNVVYQDISDKTTNIAWNITCITNHTVIYSHDFGDPGTAIQTDNFTVPTEPRGTEFRAMYNATRDV